MKEKDIFISSCGVDEDGNGKSVAMVETMYVNADADIEPKSLDKITFDGVPLNIMRTARFTMIDFQFRDHTDYDYIRTMEMLKKFSDAHNSLEDNAAEIPTIQVTITPKEYSGIYYISGVNAMWCAMSDEPGRCPDMIRFIFVNHDVSTYKLSDEAMEELLNDLGSDNDV